MKTEPFIQLNILRRIGPVLAFCFGVTGSQAQSPIEYRDQVAVYTRPVSISKYPSMDQTDGVLNKSTVNYDNLWVVYSDRGDNPARVKPAEGEAVQTTLDFMQPALVINENDKWLQLVEYKTDWCLGEGDEFKKLCGRVKVLGWVEKRKLLLWEVPLHTENKYAIKALAISTASDLQKYTASESTDALVQKKLNLYDDPGLQQKNKSDFRIFSFLFVYKFENNRYLVGKDPLIRNYRQNARKTILGWVDASSIEPWKKRICLEPTKDNYSARQKGKIYNVLFEHKSDAQQYSMDGRLSKDPIWQKQLSERPKPAIKRLPILSSETANHGGRLLLTGVVTPIYDSKGDTVWTEEAYTQMAMSKEQRDAENSIVNIIFVVEDSRQMGPYIPKAQELISEIGAELELTKKNRLMLEKRFQYRLGFVMYRESDADTCGDKSIESWTPTEDFTKLSQTFINKSHQGSCSQSKSFAVCRALDEALKHLKGRALQTNLIILMGIGANPEPDFASRRNELVDKLEQLNTSLFIFQPKNPGTDLFFDQLKQLQKSAIKMEMEWTADRWAIQPDLPNLKEEPKYDNTYKYDCPLESPLPGVIMYADPRTPMKPEMMKKFISEMVERIQLEKEKVADDADAFMRGQGERPTMNAGMRHYLASMNISEESLRKLEFNNVQLFVKGWTSTNAGTGADRQNLYKYVVFLTDKEFTDYLESLEKLDLKNETDEKLRENMESQFKALASTFVGKKEAQNMTLDRLLTLMSESEVKSDIWNKRIDQISSMPAVEFDRLKSALLSKLQGLKSYYLNPVNAHSIDEMSYYWVPTELFP